MIKLREKGFTLVEIMIVVAIIAILSAIAIPNFMSARSKSRANACKANLRQIESATEQCAMDKAKTDGDTVGMSDVVPTYIKKAPVCPSSANPTYSNSPPYDAQGEIAPTALGNEIFIVGGTTWCSIGSGASSGGFPHVQY